MLDERNDSPNKHDIIEYNIESKHKKTKEKNALDISAYFPGIKMQAWKFSKFQQR